ncbi:hexapeptide transferase [Maridesulfovibrio hydrothermalis]|uniref:Putative Hexapeptide transferase family protein n=1 Tax=Maridesulfovibrio hydrothermalis AM13 = DSM 14728 TaxID=1121451 RepID=L0R8Z5_9BACT|nr:hexapeptide transferase [Maridesulfovibrio hydrothermalis]CCO23229.1 putative Hexapeptide transferase family protein [Maridesulfovibrio hydrothermalis AM13 = DSM 14728]
MNKKRIILVGCGEHAGMVIDNIEAQNKFKIAGMTSHQPSDIGLSKYGYKVVGLDSDIPKLIEKYNIDFYFLGVGNLKVRRELAAYYDQYLNTVNIIHPNTEISTHSTIGSGNIIEAYTKIANGVSMGDHCILNSFTAINHDQTVGDNTLIAGGVNLAGRTIGSDTIISDGATIGFKVNIGNNCIIGDGAVVTKDIEDNTIAYGCPAKPIRKNE